MNRTLWTLPVPSSGLTREPYFSVSGRGCELAYYVETEDGDRKETLTFEGVEAFKCTYLTACTIEMVKTAYDRVVRMDHSPWRAEVKKSRDLFYQNYPKPPKEELQHLMIFFDDGPCYEFICVDFKASQQSGAWP